MAQDDPPRRPSGASRARTGGTAKPVDDGASPATSSRASSPPARPAAPVRTPANRAPSATPPSFSPGGETRRPPTAEHATPIGSPSRPPVPAAQPRSRAGHPGVGPSRPSAAPPAPPMRPAAALPPKPVRVRVPGSRRRRLARVAAVVVIALIAWPVGLLIWANGKIQHVDALSGAANTPGTTYLLAGSDSRADGVIEDAETLGSRTDTIMLLQVPSSGPAALISLPRDTFVDIPGHGPAKLNAAYSLGQAPLLVATVEQLTDIHVDHFVEVGLGGVKNVVDAVGGVELCLDPAVNLVDFPLFDVDSGLAWDAPGCKVADGTTALAFTRMRKADREGDIGRAKRQQQLISALSASVSTPSLALHPGKQVELIRTGLGALEVSNETDILDLGRLALGFRKATGPAGIRGTPPISDPDYRPGGVGSTVRLDPDTAPAFFAALTAGTLPAGPVGGLPTP